MDKKKVMIGCSFLGCMGLLLVGGGLAVLLLGGGGAGGGGVSGMARLVPDDAVGFVAVRGVPQLALDFMGPEVLFDPEGALQEPLQALQAFGIEARSLADFEALDLRMSGVFGASMHLRRDEPAVLFYLPTRGSGLVDRVRQTLTTEGHVVQEQELEGVTVHWSEDWGSDGLAWAECGKHTVVVVSDSRRDAKRFLEDILLEARDPVAKAAWYEALKPALAGDWQLFLGLNPALPRPVLDELLDELDLEDFSRPIQDGLRQVEGLGASAYLTAGALQASVVVVGTEQAELDGLSRGAARKDKLVAKMPRRAFMGTRLALDAEVVVSGMQSEREIREEMQEFFGEFREFSGVDLERDVIPFLGSPLSLAFYEEEGRRGPEVATAIWIPLEKDHSGERIVRDLSRGIEDEGGDVLPGTVKDGSWYSIDGSGRSVGLSGLGMVDDHLVVTISVPVAGLPALVQRSLDGKTDGLLDGIDNRVVRGAVADGPQSVFWLDMDQVLATSLGRELREDAGMAAVLQVVESIGPVLLSAEASGSQLTLELRVEARERRGFKEAFELKEELGDAQLRAQRSEAPTNVDGIRTAEKAYHHEWDSFTSASLTPLGPPGPEQVWFTAGGYNSFANLGWVADGKVRCTYEVQASNASSSAADDFDVWAKCDLDGDGEYAVFHANRGNKAVMVTPDNVY